MNEEELQAVTERRMERVELRAKYIEKIRELREEYELKMRELAPPKGRRGTKPRVRL